MLALYDPVAKMTLTTAPARAMIAGIPRTHPSDSAAIPRPIAIIMQAAATPKQITVKLI